MISLGYLHHLTGKMGYRALKWLTVVASIFFICNFEYVRHNYLEKVLPNHHVYVISVFVLVVGGYFLPSSFS